jgi:hypothetical protein
MLTLTGTILFRHVSRLTSLDPPLEAALVQRAAGARPARPAEIFEAVPDVL